MPDQAGSSDRFSQVVVVDHPLPSCRFPGCNVTLRLSRSVAAGLCCCHRNGCDEDDYYVDPVLPDATAVSA